MPEPGRERVRFKRWTSATVAWLIYAMCGFGCFAIGGGTGDSGRMEWADVPILLLVFVSSSTLAWLWSMLGVLTGVRMRGQNVIVRNFAREVEFPAFVVTGVHWVGGISLSLRGGHSIKCIAFPDSLMSLILGYRNFRGVARALEREIAERSIRFPETDEAHAEERYRWGLSTFLGILASYFLLFLLGYVIFV